MSKVWVVTWDNGEHSIDHDWSIVTIFDNEIAANTYANELTAEYNRHHEWWDKSSWSVESFDVLSHPLQTLNRETNPDQD